MSKTGYFTHPDCRKHELGPGHPECPERLDAIMQICRDPGVQIHNPHVYVVEDGKQQPEDPAVVDPG